MFRSKEMKNIVCISTIVRRREGKARLGTEQQLRKSGEIDVIQYVL